MKEHSGKFTKEFILKQQKRYNLQLIKVAIKILEKNRIKDDESIERVRREISFLKTLKNDNIIQLFEVKIFFNFQENRKFNLNFPRNGIRRRRRIILLHRKKKTPLRKRSSVFLLPNNK